MFLHEFKASQGYKSVSGKRKRGVEGEGGKEKKKERGGLLENPLAQLSTAPSSDKLVSQLSHSVIYH